MKRWADAIKSYTRAIELKDTPFPGANVSFEGWVISYHLATYHYNRGNAHAARGQYEKAIEDYTATLTLAEKVSAESPGDHHFEVTLGQHARFNRATTRYMNQDFALTFDDFSECQDVDGERSNTCLGMGNARLMQGRFGEAHDHYARGADLDPGRQAQHCKDNLAAVESLIAITGSAVDDNHRHVEYPNLVVLQAGDTKEPFPFARSRGNSGNWGWGDGYKGLQGFNVQLRPGNIPTPSP
ncbi:MAG: tetratricopeptide repeat protein [Rhodobacteraceae bacterium]|nr:tetratricopeptide repeat protein [Paracoccaceae bacterium]MCY4196963.1 tetratricopeptide repeat protein [Paracoccaceae bacterium]